MKKIICLVLALACCFALFACNKTDETLEAFLGVVNSSEPTNITTLTTHTRQDVYYSGEYKTQLGRLMLYQLSYFRIFLSVGKDGFEPPKSKDSRFTVCPIWPLWNLPISIF